MVIVLFIIAFVLGPALFLTLLHLNLRRGLLIVSASLLVVCSFVLPSNASLTPDFDPLLVSLSVFAIWLAWVVVMVFVVQTLSSTFRTPHAIRMIRAMGAMGTTVPWFGLAAARMIEGA